MAEIALQNQVIVLARQQEEDQKQIADLKQQNEDKKAIISSLKQQVTNLKRQLVDTPDADAKQTNKRGKSNNNKKKKLVPEIFNAPRCADCGAECTLHQTKITNAKHPQYIYWGCTCPDSAFAGWAFQYKDQGGHRTLGLFRWYPIVLFITCV